MDTPPLKTTPFIIALFVVFGLALIFFFSVLANYVQDASIFPTATNISLISTFTSVPSQTPTLTSTITLTPRPTWTLKPSATITDTPTPTLTSTSTLIPSITPATPAKYNDRYDLKPWDLSQQEHSVDLLQSNAIVNESTEAYRALALAEGEAILRFPEAIDNDKWRWDRAYNLLRNKDPLGISIYCEIIQSAINSGQVRINDLSTWFSSFESRLQLNYSQLTPEPGELNRGLIELIGEGSVYLWLVETPAVVNIYPLINDIDFNQPHEDAFLYTDLTGDNSPELVIYRRATAGINQTYTPYIFDLSVSPPARLLIQEQIPIDFGLETRLEIEVETDPSGNNILQLRYLLLPSCPTYVTQQLQWDGNIFIFSAYQYEIEPVSEFIAYCELVLDAAANGWGPEAAIEVTTPVLKDWPPSTDTNGHPYPPDARDQLKYRLAVLNALAGRYEIAKQYLQEIITNPVVTDSSWIVPATRFLIQYQTVEDLYTSCQQAQFCNMRDALRKLVTLSGLDDPDQMISYLQKHGVIIRSSGVFDFDKDGQNERWILIQPKPETKLEFWILSKMQHGMQAIFVQIFAENETVPYYHEPEGSVPIIQFELHKGFIFKRIAETEEAYIEWVDVEYYRPLVIPDSYNQALNALMNGSDPAIIKDELLSIYNSPRFKGDCIAYRICDQFHYTLALVYDLLGEDGNAIDQYLWVWRNYAKSPYATLARLKLDYFPLPTYTRSPVPTGTQMPTRTPTKTSTPTPTATQ